MSWMNHNGANKSKVSRLLRRVTFRSPARGGLQVLFAIAAVLFLLLDGRSGAIMSGITAVVCLVFVALPGPLGRLRTGSLIAAALAAWLASVLLAELVLPPRADALSVSADADPLIRILDEYRRTRGEFPVTLEQAGIAAPRYRGGVTFRYSREPDGTCALSIGDYNLDGFSAWWSSDQREWTFDT